MRQLRGIHRNPLAVTGMIILLAFLLMALLAPVLAPHDPLQQNLRARLLPPFWLEGGSRAYPLGTDQLGRDLASRVLYGSRVAVLVAFAATSLAMLVGVALGVVSGFFRGAWDTAIMRLVDIIVSVPNYILYLTIMALAGPSLPLLIAVIGLLGWTTTARIIRSEVLSIGNREYIEASRALGQREGVTAVRHVLPNIMGSVIALGTLKASSTIIIESTLSYLGFGVQPPTLTWGQLLSQGQQYVSTAWWLATFPGVAITLLSLSLIFLGNWLRDAFDPRTR
ncbi:MAG: ABC transporter permease [Trueperaceae bacterium]|nr:ABC transporter permease [Trueperaceae bacterium]